VVAVVLEYITVGVVVEDITDVEAVVVQDIIEVERW
jgi:hypothetical protein